MNREVYMNIIEFIKRLYPDEEPVPLHAPRFLGKEKEYLIECIDSTYVSYVGEYVGKFEESIARFTGVKHAISVVNGTAALFISLHTVGVGIGDEVITQPLTFAATAAAIKHTGAEPVFVDVDRETLGMSPESLKQFLEKFTVRKSNGLHNKLTNRKISAIVPVHILGHPCKIDEIVKIGQEYGLPVIEDAAEGLGSFYKDKHVGAFGLIGILSFNGNKTITTGSGGMVMTNDDALAEKIRYVTTTAKRPHKWEFYHDEVGYNLRMPNINAAIGYAQMEYVDKILKNKKETANLYKEYFNDLGIEFICEPCNARSNYWLNAIVLDNRNERDEFLELSNSNGVQTRPLWKLMVELPPYRSCFSLDIPTSKWLEERVVCLPSSVRIR